MKTGNVSTINPVQSNASLKLENSEGVERVKTSSDTA